MILNNLKAQSQGGDGVDTRNIEIFDEIQVNSILNEILAKRDSSRSRLVARPRKRRARAGGIWLTLDRDSTDYALAYCVQTNSTQNPESLVRREVGKAFEQTNKSIDDLKTQLLQQAFSHVNEKYIYLFLFLSY